MAQPNSVREPSMDEILASIRRIIESNDSMTSSGLATAMAEPEGFSGPAANDDGADDDRPILAFETEDHSDDYSPQAEPLYADRDTGPANMAPKTLSLADVAARVRAASERNGTMRQQKAEADVHVDAPQNPLMTARMAAASTGSVPSAEQTAPLQPHGLNENDHVQAQDGALFTGTVEGIVEPILSPAIGDQVARSFDALTMALQFSGRRSFDDIAAELLRPMLQEWLDDNLPALVEKLVRKEIERVARGPRG